MSISNPEDRIRFMNAVKEGSNCLTRIGAERDLFKEITSDLNEKYPDLSKRTINKIIRTYYKQSFNEESQSFEEFSELYESLVGGQSS